MGALFQPVALWILPAHAVLATTLVFIVIACVSYGFELFSKFTGRGIYEVMDAIASVAGGLVGMGIGWLVSWLWR